MEDCKSIENNFMAFVKTLNEANKISEKIVDDMGMSPSEILAHAAVIITGDRNKDYGDAEDSFHKIALLWGAYKGIEFTRNDVCMMMVLLKIARQSYAHKDDTLVDIAGYAALAAKVKA